MIPKIIHYCWFGRGKLSPMVEMCIDSWRKYCPDYTIKCWDEDNSPMDIPWVRDAYHHQKWAFVADYVRFYALYQEGGVYMDTDMLLIKPIDVFLKDKCFMGLETEQFANMAIIGAEKGSDFSKMVLELYNQIDFSLIMPPIIPQFVTPHLKQFGFIEEDKTQCLKNGVVIYRTDYFYPIPFGQSFLLEDVLQYAKPDTYGIHLWNYSWTDELDILAQGDIKNGLRLVFKRFARTPLLPLQYWKKVIILCFEKSLLGKLYKRIRKKHK